jgi:hypothetical protein
MASGPVAASLRSATRGAADVVLRALLLEDAAVGEAAVVVTVAERGVHAGTVRVRHLPGTAGACVTGSH